MMRDLGGGGGGEGGSKKVMKKPAWLEGLMAETFFAACGVHNNRRKNEKNIFCLDCCQSFCPHCLPSHHSHPLLQVRRYVYQDVIRLDDLEELVDCSYIQPYTTNSAKVIFLNERGRSRSCKGSANTCFTCDRNLQEPFNFCSLSCKVDDMVYQRRDLSSILHRLNESDFSLSQFEGLRMDGSDLVIDDDGQITTISIPEDPLQIRQSSCSSNSRGYPGNSGDSGATMKRKKKGSFLSGIVFSLGSRRKGTPHRSPLS